MAFSQGYSFLYPDLATAHPHLNLEAILLSQTLRDRMALTKLIAYQLSKWFATDTVLTPPLLREDGVVICSTILEN